MITVNAAFGQEEKALGTLGRVGENDTRQIVFDCSDILAEYPGAEIVCVMQRHCDRIAYLADAVLAGNVLTVTLTDADVSASGDLRIELRALTDGKIRKSAVYMGQVVSALRGAQDRPGNPIADVLNRIDMTISRAEKSIAEADAAAKSAQTVADTVQAKLDNGDFVGPAGKPGSDASVTSDNIKTALGYTPIKNVQLNGESIVQDSVATIPLAGYNRLGAVQLDPAGFAAASVEGKLALVPPTDAQISTHTYTQRPITPSCMDYAVKAAMCDGKGAVWMKNEQKAARERIGIPGDYELIEEITISEAVTSFIRESTPDGTPYSLAGFFCVITSPGVDKAIVLNQTIFAGETSLYNYGMRALDAAVNSKSVLFARVNNKILHGEQYPVGTNYEFANITRFAKKFVPDGSPITKIAFSGAIPANTKITIYGVRA